MPPENVRSWLTEMGVLAARPAAFGLFAIYGVLWITFGDGLEWHSLATLATWGMTLVIQRAEHRDTQAIHANWTNSSRLQAVPTTTLSVSTKRMPRKSNGNDKRSNAS
jgi:hypothetical protein